MRRRALLTALTLATVGCTGGQEPGAGPATTPPGTTASATASASAGPSATPLPTASPSLRPGRPRFETVGRFDQPLFVTAAPGDPRLFVVEKPGRIRVVAGGRTAPAPFLDLADQVSDTGERGMLALAFPPDHATSGKAYVYYTANDGTLTLVEYTASAADPNRADPASRRVLLEIPHPRTNHNGGTLAFDRAGMLLLSTGDGGGAYDPDGNAQNLATLLGKLLRIDPRPNGGQPYGVPPDNPYVGRTGVRPEIYAYGLRNPWRYWLDADGTLYLGDVGQYIAEEIHVVAAAELAGRNFGWPVYEGRRATGKGRLNPAGRLVEPAYVYAHSDGRCAVTGGVVYRGSVAALHGRYLFADYCEGAVLSAAPGATLRPERTSLQVDVLASFGVDAAGEVYAVSQTGLLQRITA